MSCLAIRSAAFLGRGEPYEEEFDGYDFVCSVHLLATRRGRPVGTIRVRLINAQGTGTWERLAVLPAERGGVKILKKLAEAAKGYSIGIGTTTIRGAVADPRLMKFWQRQGFKKLDSEPEVYNGVTYKQILLDLSK